MFDLESLAMPLARWAAETTLVASALALLAHLVARVSAPAPAVKHLLWLVVLIKLMTPPLIHWPWSRPIDLLATTRVEESSIEIDLADYAPASSLDPAHPGDPAASIDTDSTLTRPAFEALGVIDPGADGAASMSAARPKKPRLSGVNWPSPASCVFSAWLVGSLVVGANQMRRIARFRRTLRDAEPAPDWLIDEAERIGRRMAVGVPRIEVVEHLATPLLWCLGRPVLLVPAALLKSLESERWQGILAHELAHLRRGDQWVGRLELLASVAWWWNPLYWLARRRIDLEAELACDAWVLWALPEGRIEYAESLICIATSPVPVRPVMPSLGVAGAGRTLERRLIMILRERVAREATFPSLMAAGLLAAMAVPSWTLADSPAPSTDPTAVVILQDTPKPAAPPATTDDDDDEDDPKPAKKAVKAKPKVRVEIGVKGDVKSAPKERASGEARDPELEKKMELLGEKIAKEMEEKFGPEFQKKMELMGKDIEFKFGPEFQKKMELMGKDMEAKFGPEFQKKMELLGKEMEEIFGPNSEFVREMMTLGERLAREIGSDLDQKLKRTAKVKEKTEAAKERVETARAKVETAREKVETARARVGAMAKAKADATRARVERMPAPAKAKSDEDRRTRRIEALEERIEGLKKELEKLKAENDDEDEDENGKN